MTYRVYEKVNYIWVLLGIAYDTEEIREILNKSKASNEVMIIMHNALENTDIILYSSETKGEEQCIQKR